ncbi:MAG: hypothetical protein AAFP83_17405 [Bacteroidota bacterium]
MIPISGISCAQQGVSRGEIKSLHLLRVDDVEQIVPAEVGSYKSPSIQSVSGKQFICYKARQGSYGITQTKTSHGEYYSLEVQGVFRTISPQTSEEIARMKGGRFILKIDDFQDNVRIFGERTSPMLNSFATQLPASGSPEVTMRFTGKSLYPPIYLEVLDTCELIRQLGADNFRQPAIVPSNDGNGNQFIQNIRVQIASGSRIASVIDYQTGQLYLDGTYVADIPWDGLLYKADPQIQMQSGTYTFESQMTVIASDGTICGITFTTTYISNQDDGGFPYAFPAEIP